MNIPYYVYQVYERPRKRYKYDKNSVVLELPPEFLPEQRDPEPGHQAIAPPSQSLFSGYHQIPPAFPNPLFFQGPYHLPMAQAQSPFIGPQPQMMPYQAPRVIQSQQCLPNSPQDHPIPQNSQAEQHLNQSNSLSPIENSTDIPSTDLEESRTQDFLSNNVDEMISTVLEQNRTSLPNTLYKSVFHTVKLCLSYIYHEIHSAHREVI